uniref:RELT like 2 n=1 Tax=Sinocyclocheilus anshuiensis TaxID=1608454 RepID=A0A671RFV3_9TELE
RFRQESRLNTKKETATKYSITNMEAFKEMLVSQNVREHHDPRLRHKDSVSGLPLHHHTVHLGGEISSCVHCLQEPRTMFSVGRFRVTRMEKRNSLQGSMNLPVPKLGNTSNDTTLSDSRTCSKDTSKKPPEDYNIRNMFGDGKVPNLGKRKKSVTLLGFYKAGNPAESKAGQKVFVEDKEESSTTNHLSECCSSGAPSPTETTLDENSNKTSGNQLQETLRESGPENQKTDEATLNVDSQDKIRTNTLGIVGDGSNSCSRFSVRTVEETITTPAAAADNRDDVMKHNDLKPGQASQESTDTQQ